MLVSQKPAEAGSYMCLSGSYRPKPKSDWYWYILTCVYGCDVRMWCPLSNAQTGVGLTEEGSQGLLPLEVPIHRHGRILEEAL